MIIATNEQLTAARVSTMRSGNYVMLEVPAHTLQQRLLFHPAAYERRQDNRTLWTNH